MERSRLLAAFSFAAIAIASPLTAQWTAVPAPTPPPAPAGAVLVPWQNGELLLFGGDAATNPAATEWSWNGIRWAPVTTPVPRRDFAPIARNEGDGSLLLCGGVSSIGTTLNDTWRFAAGTWTQLFPTTVPTNQPVFLAHAPDTDDMVLLTQGPLLTYDTWLFTGGDWAHVNTFTAAAPVVALFADTVRSEVCLVTSSATTLAVRRLAGLAWIDVAQIPAAASPTWAAFDAGRGRAVIVQAQPVGTWRTFEYDGVQLVAQPVATVPSSVGLARGALAYHAERHEVLLAGGTGSLETWRWAVDAVPMATAYGAPCVLPSFQLGLAAGDSPEPGGVHRLRADGGNASALTLSLLGFSHVQTGVVPLPVPIPIGALGCQLRVDPLVLTFLGVGTPVQQAIAVPNAPSLLGARYDAQCVQFDATGITDATNGLEVQLGRPLPANVLLETFATDASRDAAVSGDTWGNGSVSPVAIGGDGRHGSFSVALLGAPSPSGVYTWNTQSLTIPAANTLSGVPEIVTDGRFFFTDFVVPANASIRFVGEAPARILVRGVVDVQGTLDVSGASLPGDVVSVIPSPLQPPIQVRVSTFVARGTSPGAPPAVPFGQVPGQPGSQGFCGGGDGGNGGCEGNNLNPGTFNGIDYPDGQPGAGVTVSPSHVNAALAAATRGLGSEQWPSTGIASVAVPNIPTIPNSREEFSRGGSGGGFFTAGGSPTTGTPAIQANPPATVQPSFSPIPAGGAAFPLFPYPPAGAPAGYQSIDHFLVGGSGGGGGGSHSFGVTISATSEVWNAGHGGTGGGGALALRAGGDVTIGGTLRSRGGDGVWINGDNRLSTPPTLIDIDWGISSPGGGGSGGSFVVQSARTATVTGTIDTSGGSGSQTGAIYPTAIPSGALSGALNVRAQGGTGSSGFYRVESTNAVAFTSTTSVPPFSGPSNAGSLTDQDALTGSRSLWLVPPSGELPYWLRYELVADVGGQTVVFSDDPAVSALAANGPGAVRLRVQGAQVDPFTGLVVPATIGPWRSQLAPGDGSLNRDRAQAVRFDLVLDKSVGPVVVRELRLVWR